MTYGFDGAYGTDVRPGHRNAAKSWAKDESAPGVDDGTRLTASVINDIVANLRGVSTAASTSMPEGDATKLSRAIAQLITNAIDALVAGAPGALNTLKELADAINDDASYAATVTTALGLRLRVDAAQSFSGGQKTQGIANLGGTTQGQAIFQAASYAAMKTLLAITAADITDASANGRSLITAANYAAMKTLLAIAASDVSGLAAIATSGSASDLSAGTLPAGRFPALTGDVTTSAGALAATIAAGAVSLAKMANLAANSIIGNNTGSPATPIALTASQVKTLLAIAAGDVSGLAAIATSGSASDLSAGTLPAGRFPALTGDVTTSAGALAATIAAGAVSLAKMANLAANSIIGNNTGSAATPIALTAAQVKTLLAIASSDVSGLAASATTDTTNAANISSGVLALARGGSGQGSAAAARGSSGFNIDAMTTHGDSDMTIAATDRVVATSAALTAARVWTLPAANALNPGQRLLVLDLAGGCTSTNKISVTRAGSDTVNGGTAADLASANGGLELISDGVSKWSSQALGSAAALGVSSFNGRSGAVSPANDDYAIGNLAAIADQRLVGNNTGGSARPIVLTAAQVKTILAIAAGDVSGLATVATSASASDLSTGTLAAGRMPALTGAVTTSAGAVATSSTIDLVVIIGDGTNVISTGVGANWSPQFDFAATIVQWTILSNVSGSISIDVWKCTYSQFDSGSTHPVAGDKISATAPITFSSATKGQSSTLTGWTTSIAAGDILAFNVASVTSCKQVVIALKLTKTS